MVFGLFFGWFRAPALLAGWAVGIVGGSWLVWPDGLKPVQALTIGGSTITVYTGLLALAANIVVVVLVNLVTAPRVARAA